MEHVREHVRVVCDRAREGDTLGGTGEDTGGGTELAGEYARGASTKH